MCLWWVTRPFWVGVALYVVTILLISDGSVDTQLFQEGLSDKEMCTRQPRMVIWDLINTLFLTTVAVEPDFAAFLKHSQTYIHGLSCYSFKFLWRTVNSKPPTIPIKIVACTFSDHLSRNSCILRYFHLCVHSRHSTAPYAPPPLSISYNHVFQATVCKI